MLLITLLFSLQAAAAATFKTNMIQFDPWTRLVAGGDGSQTEGIIVDLLNEFERRSGYKTERTMVPCARVEQNLQQGSTDFSLMAWGEARALCRAGQLSGAVILWRARPQNFRHSRL